MPSNNTLTHPRHCAMETLDSKCQGSARSVSKNKYPPPLLPELICTFPQKACMNSAPQTPTQSVRFAVVPAAVATRTLHVGESIFLM